MSGERLQDHWSSGLHMKNKGTVRLHGNGAADQLLCFRCIYSTIPLLPNSET